MIRSRSYVAAPWEVRIDVSMFPSYGVWYSMMVGATLQRQAELTKPGHILTCSQLAELGLQSSTVSMIQRPTRGPPHVPFIKVTDGGNCIWQLGLDDCRTWFVSSTQRVNITHLLTYLKSFTAHFMDIKGSQSGVARRFGDIFRVTMGGRTIGPRDWDKVMTKAQKGSAHLVLIRRCVQIYELTSNY